MNEFQVETPATLLRDAAGLLRRDGWTQGQTYDHAGRRCILGAILRVVRHYAPSFVNGVMLADPVVHGAVNALHELVRESCGPVGWFGDVELPLATVIHWNDNLCFGGEDAAQALEKAAAWWEEKNGA